MIEAERHRVILEVLRDRPFASVRDLQDVLDASPATIRRDIAKLHAQGAVRKVFGGIAAAEPVSGLDRLAARSFTENQMLGVSAKWAIAEEAAKLVQDGDAVMIHGGTTCFLFATMLASRSVRIYTNSMPIAAALWQNGTCHLTLGGGDLYREPGILSSPQARPPEFFASKFFLGAQAIGAAGLQESHPLVVRQTELLMQHADEMVVLVDSRKFGIRARYPMLALTRIGTLITDDAITEAHHRMLTDAGIRVIVARTSRDSG